MERKMCGEVRKTRGTVMERYGCVGNETHANI
jgi:hypothetical protein